MTRLHQSPARALSVRPFPLRPVLAALAALAVSACAGGGRDEAGPISRIIPGADNNGVSTEIAVNGFLWRASLDTIEFMPLESADPFGGVIITDWYTNPEFPNERFKAEVYILDSRLRADALKVEISKQLFDQQRGWINGPLDEATAIQIENAILTRARELRIATLDE